MLPPWPSVSSTSLFCIFVQCTGDRHRVGVVPGSAQPPPPPGSTLVMSLPENRISNDDIYDDAPLILIKFFAMFYLSHSLLYSGVPYTIHIYLFIEDKYVGRCIVVSLRDHQTLYISFFIFFAPHCRNADTDISACAFIVRHVLPIYIPVIMLPRLGHFGPDDRRRPNKR